MDALNPYLTFNGNARAAMTFYQECLGGELYTMTFGEAHASEDPSQADRLMHANLHGAFGRLMASDTMPGMPFTQGNNFSISLHCTSSEEVDRLHAALAGGGKVVMAAQETFWAQRFGMVVDKFGIGWMFNHEKPMTG